jgi:type II secretory pathway pseudopilin PulG
MREFKFACPDCGQHIAASEEHTGAQVVCPGCNTPLIVPAAAVVAAPRPSLGLKIGRVLAAVYVVLVCLFVCWRVWLAWQVHSQFAHIKAAGYPASGAEVNTWLPAVPAAENGALVMTQAFAFLRTFPDVRSNAINAVIISHRTNQLSAAVRGLVQAYLQTNAQALLTAQAALRTSRFRYPVDYSYGPGILLPHLSPLKRMAIVVSLETALDADPGQGDKWTEDVDFETKLAGTLDDEPVLISYLTRCSVLTIAARGAERSLNRGTPSAEACQRLQADFTRAAGTNLLPGVLVCERAVYIPAFRLSWNEMHSFDEDSDQNRTIFDPPPKPVRFSGNPFLPNWIIGFWERDLSFYLQTMDKSISLASSPLPGSLTLTNYMGSRSDLARRRLCILSGMTLPSLGKIILQEARTQALLRLAATAMAVERYRHERGRLPVTLSDLTPQFLDGVPTDPFDGAPLRYRPLMRGYEIYSVDADGRDDGGREPPGTKTPGETYDLTFIVEH